MSFHYKRNIMCFMIFFFTWLYCLENLLDVLILCLLFTTNVMSSVVCLVSWRKSVFNGSKPWILYYLKADVEDVQNNSKVKHDFHWLVQINAFFCSSRSLTVCVTRPWNSFSLEHSFGVVLALVLSTWRTDLGAKLVSEPGNFWARSEEPEREKLGDSLPQRWHLSACSLAEDLVFVCVCDWH